jgi:hypothetical protein
MSVNRNTDIILSSANQLLMPLLCITTLPYFLLPISARVVVIFVQLCVFLCVRGNAVSSITFFTKFSTRRPRAQHI